MSEDIWPENLGGPKHRITVLGVPMRVWKNGGSVLAVGDRVPDHYAISGDVRTAAQVIICREYEVEIEKKLEKTRS
jgi:hypothetical protein